MQRKPPDYDRSDFDLHGRIKQSRFHLPEPSGAGSSEHERGREAFASLTDDQQIALVHWLWESTEPDVPRRGADWEQLRGVLYAFNLADQATAALGFQVNTRAMNGACIDAGYWPVRPTGDQIGWAVGAAYKQT